MMQRYHGNKIITFLLWILLLLLQQSSGSNNDAYPDYNDPSDCDDVCEGTFIFRSIEDAKLCCEVTIFEYEPISSDGNIVSGAEPPDRDVGDGDGDGGGDDDRYSFADCSRYPGGISVKYYYGKGKFQDYQDFINFPPPRRSGDQCLGYNNNNNGRKPNNNIKFLIPIIGGIAGGIVILVILLFALRPFKKQSSFLAGRRRRRRSSSGDGKPTLKKTDTAGTSSSSPTPLPLPPMLQQSPSGQRINSDIFVDRDEEDVSTLGDPVYTPGMMMMLQQQRIIDKADGGTVGSTSLDYDYKKQPDREDSLNVNSLLGPASKDGAASSSDLSSMTYTDGGGLLLGKQRLNTAWFVNDDDAVSFEQQFKDFEERFDVEVPPGKLGMVIDTPIHGGIPFVLSIRDSSILVNRGVKVGDRLLSVDDFDTTECTATQVSKLISDRATLPKRKLTFLRTKGSNSFVKV